MVGYWALDFYLINKMIKAIIKYHILLLLLFTSFCKISGQTQSVAETVYIMIEIKGLACPYCAYGMEKELKKISGVDNVTILLKKGQAYISTPILQKPTKPDLKKIIIKAGFTPGKIEYKTTPFKIEGL